MIVFKRFVILQDPQNSLENTIHFLLNCEEYSWDKIYLFSAFVTNDGVDQIEKILVHPSLNKNTEVMIAIGTKDDFNKPSDIQKILSLSTSQKIQTNNVDFICPEIIDYKSRIIDDESHSKDNFHIKAYCFLGSSMKAKSSNIGFSIIGSSNLTQTGLKGKGELCISIQNLNLTNKLIEHLKNKYSHLPRWSPEIIREYEIKYDKKHPRKDQAPITSTPLDGKFIELGVITDIALNDKATNLANDKENIDCFHSSPTTLEQAKEDFREGSLCLLFLTKNEEFRIVEIMPYLSDQENTEGCFVRFRENVIYKRSEDIDEILANEKYKIISDAKDMEELPYEILKDFEEEVNEYQEYQKMLADPKYQKWIEKGKKKTQLEIIDRILEIGDPTLMKKELELLRQSI
ncbi:hypothetical protein QUB10_30085 [Microcoleus sp. B5-D4]|uniref:hypothetical protein n=1 Tax=unclassified Microcoleus TaxID=2642155 RepID=UPI002FCEA5D1